MVESSGFGVLLARLMTRRGLTVGALSETAAVPESELAAVLAGATPSPELLRRLAPTLGWHAADVFVIAELPVPEDLAPLEVEAGDHLSRLIWSAAHLPGQAPRILELVRAHPQQARTQPVPPPPKYHQYPSGPGAMLLRMTHIRNMSWVDAAKCLFLMARIGPLAASTIGMIGRSEKALTPELVAGFATVLGIPAGDLAALTGVDLADSPQAAPPAARDIVELIWAAQRCTADQLWQLRDQLHEMRHEVDELISPSRRCNCTRLVESG